MAMRSGFFESDIVGYDAEGLPKLDRAEDAEFHAEYFKSFIGSGVFPNPADNFKVKVGEGMKLEIAPGRCFIQGFFAFDYASDYKTLDAADPILNRIDRIVLRLDLPERYITIEIKKGTPSEHPVPPPLTRPETGSADIYELGIADVLVVKNSVSITQDKITDLRLSTEHCGIVHGTVDQVDLQEIFDQYEAYLNTHMAAWDAREAQQTADWQAQMDLQQKDMDEIANWYEGMKTNINTRQAISFDDICSMPGTSNKTEFPGDDILATAAIAATGKKLATQHTTFSEDGSIVETVTVYAEDGVTVMRTQTKTTVFNTDGSIQEVIS